MSVRMTPGATAVDADAARPQLLRQRLRQGQHARPSPPSRHASHARADLPPHGGHVEDAAALLRAASAGSTAPGRSGTTPSDVHGEHAGPTAAGVICVDEGRSAQMPALFDEHVRRPAWRETRVQSRPCCIRHVAADGHSARLRRATARCRRVVLSRTRSSDARRRAARNRRAPPPRRCPSSAGDDNIHIGVSF